MIVREIIDDIISRCGGVKFEKTCDQIIFGSEDMEVSGVVTTFMATAEVIKKTIEIGANFIITHEPTYYTGTDRLDWLENDPVYLKKKKFLEENEITIWRFHDHMHAGTTDLIYQGLINELGWEDYLVKDLEFPHTYEIPEISLQELVEFFKRKFKMDTIRIIGSPDMKLEKVGILVGGGSMGLGTEEMPMNFMREHDIDVMVCGDIIEWTLTPYVRDAISFEMNKAMIILGHERSEEWGMKYLADWLQPTLGKITATFIDAEEPFKYL